MGEKMSWRELSEAIDRMPDHMKDDLACVWLPGDVDWNAQSEFVGFSELVPFNADEEPGEDNPFSLSTGL